MRARNIKPGFFQNEALPFLDTYSRLLFIGMWMLADREGRMEDRPLRIKAQVFPYENVDCNKYLTELEGAGFIHRYEIGNNKYIQVVNFLKHQNPHVREKPSTIPASDKVVPSTEKVVPSPADSLNPDSLNPDSHNKTPKKPVIPYPEWLDMEAWSDWKQHRKEIRKPMTPLAEKKAINKLQSMLNGISQRQIIDHCIANGYQGLFPPTKQNGAEQKGDIYARA